MKKKTSKKLTPGQRIAIKNLIILLLILIVSGICYAGYCKAAKKMGSVSRESIPVQQSVEAATTVAEPPCTNVVPGAAAAPGEKAVNEAAK